MSRLRDQDVLHMWRRLSVLNSRVNDAVEKALQVEYRLTSTEFAALMSLAEAEDGAMRMSPLADAVGLNQSSLTRLIARLEQRGLAERCVCAEDKRGVYSRITDEGRAIATSAREPSRQALSRAFDDASFDELTAPLVARLRYQRPGD